MEELQTISTLQGVEIALRKELEHIAEGYIKVGYLLKKTRDAEFYKEKGYADVFEFAKETFNISRTWAIRFMQINDTYSIDGNSPEIQEKYRGYGSSKLSEMLALPEEVREVVPRDATVRERSKYDQPEDHGNCGSNKIPDVSDAICKCTIQ